jgi:hypothetical protein
MADLPGPEWNEQSELFPINEFVTQPCTNIGTEGVTPFIRLDIPHQSTGQIVQVAMSVDTAAYMARGLLDAYLILVHP